MSAPLVRPAVLTDLKDLLNLEHLCFTSDLLSRRSFRHFLSTTSNCFLVCEQEQKVLGYILVLLHEGTQLARLYSIAVNPECRGLGVAQRLLDNAEQICAQSGRISMRLEVRRDNHSAIALYQKRGYFRFGEYKDYYEDHEDALRLQKRILYPGERTTHVDVPYYPQHTDFTCGPAALMMAMSALNPEQALTVTEELRIWREATTIYMMAGHGGCSPVGLALAAIERGVITETYLSTQSTPFIDSVRDDKKKQIIELVHDDYLERLQARGGTIHYKNITQDDLEAALKQGDIPLILISTYRFDGQKTPHWVLVTAMDDRFIYLHDPLIDEEFYRFELDNQYLPISRKNFDKMAQFGQSRLRTAVILKRRQATE